MPILVKVDKDPRANRRHRLRTCQRLFEDDGFAADQRALCRDDIVYWVNTYCWIQEPRNVGDDAPPRTFPWITYDYQDALFAKGQEVLGKRNLTVPKSRCTGVTWWAIAMGTHGAQFHREMTFGYVSREEKLVDGTRRSLFAKIQFLLDCQPRQLVGRYEHFHMRFAFYDTDSSIEGATTGAHVFRGDRYTATFHDEVAARDLKDGDGELASSFAVTRSRFMFSTPLGSVGAFYEVCHNPNIERVDIHWTMHPEYAKGLRFEGPPVTYGKLYFPGRPTSPWYEAECKLLGSDAKVAAELDLDFGGSGKPYFRPEMVEEHRRLHARPPSARGRLEYGIAGLKESIRFVEDPNGWLLLWCHLGGDGRATGEAYAAGSDISTGQGATPSTMSVAERVGREKVAEVATAHMDPKEFADAAFLVCWVFREPYYVWELQGPGVQFGKALLGLGYKNVYYRKNELSTTGKVESSYTPGWVPTKGNKEIALGRYRTALATQSFLNHSDEALRECPLYTYGKDGTVQNALIRTGNFEARDNHGDRVVADFLCNLALGEPDLAPAEDNPEGLPEDRAILLPGHPLHYSPWGRMVAEKLRESEEEEAWPTRFR